MKNDYKRVNILIRPDQYQQVSESGLSLSGLVRDLIDDRFSKNSIVLSVSDKTSDLYNYVISNFGADDLELERYLLSALDNFLSYKGSEIDRLRQKIQSSTGEPSEDT